MDPETYHNHLVDFPSLAYSGYSGHMRQHKNPSCVQGRHYASRLQSMRNEAAMKASGQLPKAKSKFSKEKSLMQMVEEEKARKQKAGQVSMIENGARAAENRYQNQLKRHENVIAAGAMLGKMRKAKGKVLAIGAKADMKTVLAKQVHR